MHCTKCGAELAPESKFCVSCGTPAAQAVAETPVAPVAPVVEAPVQQAAPVATEAPKKEGVKIDVNEVKDQLIATVKPLWDKVKPFLTNKKVLIGIAAVVLVLVAFSIVATVLTSGNGYIIREQSTKLVYSDESLSIIVNGKQLKDTIDDVKESKYSEGQGEYHSSSNMNGKVTAVLAYSKDNEDYTGTLYVINGKKLLEVADNVYDFELSVSGDGLAYITREENDDDSSSKYSYSLYLYNVGKKKSVTISDDVYARGDYAIAPDGKSVAFFEVKENEDGDDEHILKFSKGKDATKITSSECELIGMSNGGKYIYATCKNDKNETYLYSYDTKGERDKLGQISSDSIYFNSDHTQIMFTNEGKTYISTKGKEAVKASSNQISLMVAPNASTFYGSHTTYPVTNLYNHVYAVRTDGSIGLWVIKKNADKNVKLVSNVSYAQLDESAEYLYYLYDGDELRMIKISDGDKATERYVEIAEDVNGFVVTSDRKFVYFSSDDSVYSVNGKKGGKATVVCNDKIEDYAINGKDVFYYIVDGDLYATSNGKKGRKVLSDVSSVSYTVTGLMYAENDDALYVSTGSKKPKKIMDLD